METSKKAEWHVTEKEWQEEAVLDHLNCCLCGSALKLKHKVDHIHQIATEDAHCASCGVKHRTAQHRLQ
jgi:C4-type Zn-finger protein